MGRSVLDDRGLLVHNQGSDTMPHRRVYRVHSLVLVHHRPFDGRSLPEGGAEPARGAE
jgi:hypothetical protein